MAESAESVAKDVDSKRSVTIEVKNQTDSYLLLDPRVYLDKGETYNPPQPTVRPGMTEVCTFTKSSGGATGCVGVLTYDLFHRHSNAAAECLALMFSVPWDYNLYKNWLAVGIYPKGRPCNEALYKEMYYEKKQCEHGFARAAATGSALTYVGPQMEVRATMCPLEKAILKVELWDRHFTPRY